MNQSKPITNAIVKLSAILILAATSWWLWLSDLVEAAGERLDGGSPIPLSSAVLIIWWAYFLLMISDLLFHRKMSLYATPAIYPFTFFTGNDSLWASELVWQKNWFSICLPPLLFVSALALVIYRMDPQMKWAFASKTDVREPKPPTNWRELSGSNKFFTIIGALGAFTLAYYVPYKVNLTFGYLTADQAVIKHAEVIGAGFTRGKYFYHRYWRIVVDGREEKFWVYAAAKTEPAARHTCSTSANPKVGSGLKIQGRQGIYGFSYDRIIWIKAPDGKVICD